MNPHETLREALACVGLCAIVFCLLVRCSEAKDRWIFPVRDDERREALVSVKDEAIVRRLAKEAA